MAQVDKIQEEVFEGPSAMRSILAPAYGRIYHEDDTGFSYSGDGVQWVRSWSHTGLDMQQPPPGFGVEVPVPVSVWHREIFGSATLKATPANAASIEFWAQDNHGDWKRMGRLSVEPSPANVARETVFRFLALGGRAFKFLNGGLPGTTEIVSDYGWHDT